MILLNMYIIFVQTCLMKNAHMFCKDIVVRCFQIWADNKLKIVNLNYNAYLNDCFVVFFLTVQAIK